MRAFRAASQMRPAFLVVNVMFMALAMAAWFSGFFEGFPALDEREIAMLSLLGAYGAIGFGAAAMGKWDVAEHIGNGAPVIALAMTVIGLLFAVASLGALTPEALATVFKKMCVAVTPNALAVAILFWLRELQHWSQH